MIDLEDICWDIDDDELWPPNNVTCHWCHERGLNWQLVAGAWRLFDEDSMHVCHIDPHREFKVLK